MATPLGLWLFSEAASGTTPTTVADTSAGTPVNLTVALGTGGSWTSVAAGNGIYTGSHYGNAQGTNATLISSPSLNGTKLAALNGSTTITWEYVLTCPTAHGNGGTIGDICPPDISVNTLGCLYHEIGANWESWAPSGTSHAFTVVPPTAGTVTVVTVVIDTTQATATNRAKVYYNGVEQTIAWVDGLPLNSTVTIDANSYLQLCDDINRNWCTTLWLYYLAVYATALSPSEVAANATALLAANDTNPNAAGSGPTITTQPSSVVVLEGSLVTFSISATTSGGTLHYQWKRNGSNVGTDSSTLSLTALAVYDGSTITCVVTDDNGNVTSSSATLTVVQEGETMWADRVKETSTTTGTSNFTLAGAATGFRTVNAALGVGPQFNYTIEDGTDWEVGRGHLSDATTLVRDAVEQSSNGNALVNFAAGTKNVFVSFSARAARVAGALSSIAANQTLR